MAREDDDILLGGPVLLESESRDSDGDGVSDVQERLDGTDPHDAGDHREPDPTLAPREGVDPRGGLEAATLERETVFDRNVGVPAGQSLAGGLAGLTNVDGSKLPTGTNHYGVGKDGPLAGRVDANSPHNVQRDPLAAAPTSGKGGRDPLIDTLGRDPGPAASGGSRAANATTPPPGAELSSNAPHWELVSEGRQNSTAGDLAGLFRPAAAPEKTKVDPADAHKPADAGTPLPPIKEYVPPAKMSDPDSGGAGGPTGPVTQDQVDHAVMVRGGNVDVVQGFTKPEIEGGKPPARPIDHVRDPIEPGSDTVTVATGTPPKLAGDAAVVHTINPADGFGGRPTGGHGAVGGVGGNTSGRDGTSSAATAADGGNADQSQPTVTAVGSGTGSGIHTAATSPDEASKDAGGVIDHSTAQDITVQQTGDVRPPDLAPPIRDGVDPRADVERGGLERETVFDKGAGLPAGHSLDGGLVGLTNIDGSALPTATNHYGIGDGVGPDGRHVGGTSPLAAQRDPLASPRAESSVGRDHLTDTFGRAPGPAASGGTTVRGGYGDAPPPGQTPSGSADPGHDPALVSGFVSWVRGDGWDPPAPDAGTAKEPVRPPGDTPIDRHPKQEPAPDAGTPKPHEPMVYDTNPDADTGAGAPTHEVVEHAVAVHGGNIDVVQGHGGGPQIEGDAPPTRPIDLVTDGGDDSGKDTTTTEALHGAPDASVVHTINPDSGIDRPTSGGPPHDGGGGFDHLGMESASSAATGVAAPPDEAGAHGISEVGPGFGGGIHATEPAAATHGDDVLGASHVGIIIPDTDMPTEHVGIIIPDFDMPVAAEAHAVDMSDPGAAAVHSFATEYLHDASFESPLDGGHDLVAAGLTPDLNAEPMVHVDEDLGPIHQLDPGGTDMLEGSIPGDHDGDGFVDHH